MVVDDVANLIKGYYCIIDKNGSFQYLQYSPFDGRELPGGFLHVLEGYVSIYLMENEDKYNKLYDTWCDSRERDSPDVDFNLMPDDLKYMLTDRSWYEEKKRQEREDHRDGEFCWEMNCFIDDCRSDYIKPPKLACVPIQYCPFCGVKLPPEFDQENWWEKEFKTFKWDKDHKLREWADDYVDDCDWDYPLIGEKVEEEKKET